MPRGKWRDRFAFALQTSLRVLGPHRQTLRALAPAMVGEGEEGLFARATAFSRTRVQGAFRAAVVGASDAPAPRLAEALARLLYLLHLAVILWWLLDRSAGQRATAGLVALLAPRAARRGAHAATAPRPGLRAVRGRSARTGAARSRVVLTRSYALFGIGSNASHGAGLRSHHRHRADRRARPRRCARGHGRAARARVRQLPPGRRRRAARLRLRLHPGHGARRPRPARRGGGRVPGRDRPRSQPGVLPRRPRGLALAPAELRRRGERVRGGAGTRARRRSPR